MIITECRFQVEKEVLVRWNICADLNWSAILLSDEPITGFFLRSISEKFFSREKKLQRCRSDVACELMSAKFVSVVSSAFDFAFGIIRLDDINCWAPGQYFWYSRKATINSTFGDAMCKIEHLIRNEFASTISCQF